MLDLTILLATGKASESIADYLGSGEHMSERVREMHYQRLHPSYPPSRASQSGRRP